MNDFSYLLPGILFFELLYLAWLFNRFYTISREIKKIDEELMSEVNLLLRRLEIIEAFLASQKK